MSKDYPDWPELSAESRVDNYGLAQRIFRLEASISKARAYVVDYMWDSDNDHNRQQLLTILDGTEQQ